MIIPYKVICNMQNMYINNKKVYTTIYTAQHFNLSTRFILDPTFLPA